MVVDNIVFDVTFTEVKDGDLVEIGEGNYGIAKYHDSGASVLFLEDGETDNLFDYGDECRIVHGEEKEEAESRFGVNRFVVAKSCFDARMVEAGYAPIPDTNGWSHKNGSTFDNDMKPAPIINNLPVWVLYELGETTPPPF